MTTFRRAGDRLTVCPSCRRDVRVTDDEHRVGRSFCAACGHRFPVADRTVGESAMPLATLPSAGAHAPDARIAVRADRAIDVTRSAPIAAGVPPCPGCGASLVLDGDWHRCDRCGRAYTVGNGGKGGFAGVYREALVVVPVHEPAPLAGLQLGRGSLELDVSIGSPLGTHGSTHLQHLRSALSRLSQLSLLSLLAAMVATVFWEWSPAQRWYVLFTLPIALDFLTGMVMSRAARDHLKVEGGSLDWWRERGFNRVQLGTVALARVAGVHDAGDHIRVDLDDGTHWKVGNGLEVPRRVRRWVAQRVAHLLPPRAHGAGRSALGTGEPAP